MQKLVKLEMVGKRQEEEEEPEGEVIVGPSGEAVEQSLGNDLSFLSFFSKTNYLFNHTSFIIE